jgi:hypothetical protein
MIHFVQYPTDNFSQKSIFVLTKVLKGRRSTSFFVLIPGTSVWADTGQPELWRTGRQSGIHAAGAGTLRGVHHRWVKLEKEKYYPICGAPAYTSRQSGIHAAGAGTLRGVHHRLVKLAKEKYNPNCGALAYTGRQSGIHAAGAGTLRGVHHRWVQFCYYNYQKRSTILFADPIEGIILRDGVSIWIIVVQFRPQQSTMHLSCMAGTGINSLAKLRAQIPRFATTGIPHWQIALKCTGDCQAPRSGTKCSQFRPVAIRSQI